jgi:hypothetical protein
MKVFQKDQAELESSVDLEVRPSSFMEATTITPSADHYALYNVDIKKDWCIGERETQYLGTLFNPC